MSAPTTKRVITNVPRPRISHGSRVENSFVLAPGAVPECFFAYEDVEVNNATQSCVEHLSQLCKGQG